MRFSTIIHEASYRKVQHFLYERLPPGSDLHGVQDKTAFMIVRGSAAVIIDVAPIEGAEAAVTVSCRVVTGARCEPALLAELLAENARRQFGAFAIDGESIILQHSMVGSTLNREELWLAVEAIATRADEADDDFIARFGGETSTARLAATEPNETAAPVSQLRLHLEGRGLQVTAAGPEAAAGQLDAIAARIGRDLAEVTPLLKAIEYSLRKKRGFRLELAQQSPAGLDRVVSLGKLLVQNTLLASFYHARAEKRVHGTAIMDNHHILQFFTGGWLEGFARTVLRTELHRLGRGDEEVEVLSNVKGMINNGPLELDVLGRVADRLVWIECKTGEYASHVERYKRLGDQLAIPPAARLLLLSRIDDKAARSLNALHGLTAVEPTGLPEAIRAAVEAQVRHS